MRRLSVFNFLTLNGFYKGPDEDILWHRHGGEESDYAAESVRSENVLLFGRKTYELMATYWPTSVARELMPEVAKGMNNAEKIVFTRTLREASWKNTRIVNDNIVGEIRQLKNTPGKDLTILGSGSIVRQFAEAGLIDNFEFMIDPVALGGGTTLFAGITHKLNLKLISSRVFKSGVVLLNYEKMGHE